MKRERNQIKITVNGKITAETKVKNDEAMAIRISAKNDRYTLFFEVANISMKDADFFEQISKLLKLEKSVKIIIEGD